LILAANSLFWKRRPFYQKTGGGSTASNPAQTLKRAPDSFNSSDENPDFHIFESKKEF
jgi:hypothetical protein